jgi:fatty acid-binding protein DegV
MEFLKTNRSNTRHIGVLYDLFYLNRAGRVSFAKALLGTAFKILPILSSTDVPGSLQTVGKAKTQAQANQILMNIIEDDFNKKNGKRISCSIAYCGDRKDDAFKFKELLEKKGWPVESEIHYTQHSNMVHEGPEFFDMGYIIYS